MTGSELVRAMRWKNKRDVKIASMTWEQRKESVARDERWRLVMQVCFFVCGFACGMGSFTDIMTLLGFGILGPLALRYDLL